MAMNRQSAIGTPSVVIAVTCAAVAAVGATLLASELGQAGRAVRAVRIEVLDRQGVARIVLEVRDDIPQVVFMSPDGRRTRLALQGDDRMPGVVVHGAGSGEIRLGVEHDKCLALRMCKPDGDTLICAGTDVRNNAVLGLYRARDQLRPAVTAEVNDNVAKLSVLDDDGEPVWRTQSPTTPK